MAVHLIARIEIRSGQTGRFMQAMPEVAAAAVEAGWKLDGSYMQRTGRVNTLVNVWELEDYGHLDRGWAAMADNPRFQAVAAILGEAVVNETLTFADKLSYSTLA
jgi:hypothetical protein